MSLPIFHFSEHSHLGALTLGMRHLMDRFDSKGNHSFTFQNFLYSAVLLHQWPPGRLMLTVNPFSQAWKGGSG